MNRPTVPVWLWPCIAATVILSGYSIYLRHQVEARNKAVSIAVEFETVESLAASNSTPVDVALTNLKAQGVGAIVLGEETVGDLLYEGYANISGNEIRLKLDRVVSSEKAIEALSNRVERGLKARFPKAKIVIGQEEGERVIRTEFASPALIRQTAIGINPSIAQLVTQSGLDIVARMSNPSGVSSEYVASTVAWAREVGARIFLPQGDQVLGRRDSVNTLVDAIRTNGMLYASPEFTKIGGDANVVAAAPELVVRLHSAQIAELDKLPLDEAIDRYAKAARERNMRMLLVRPVSLSSADPLHTFVEFVKSINDEIRREGGDMGPARPFEDPGVPAAVLVLISISTVPSAYFVATALVRNRTWALGLVAVCAVVALASITSTGRSFAALEAAILFPIAAFLILDGRDGNNIVAEFFIVSIISLVGGLVVAGLLTGLPYLVKAQEFRGIKVAVFTPVLVVAWYFAARFSNLKEAMKNPITWGTALLAIVGLAGLAFMNARTGNDNPAGVSDLELKFRSILDALLFVRPRTKSFLIGHPALIIGIGLLLWHRKRQVPKLVPWIALCLTVGAIGQTDIVNTLCHLHTPVALSLLRNLVGLLPGCLIGLGLWYLIKSAALKPRVAE